MALTLADGLCDIGISSVYQHDTLTINREGGSNDRKFSVGTNYHNFTGPGGINAIQ